MFYTSECLNTPRPLAMKNSLPYLSKDLFWGAMEDISKNTTLVAGLSFLTQLRELVQQQIQGEKEIREDGGGEPGQKRRGKEQEGRASFLAERGWELAKELEWGGQ